MRTVRLGSILTRLVSWRNLGSRPLIMSRKVKMPMSWYFSSKTSTARGSKAPSNLTAASRTMAMAWRKVNQ